MNKANHRVNIVRVQELLPHTNADSLELIHIEGYQVVVKKGEFKVGDLAVYIQPDSVVPQTEPFRFIWEGQVGIDGLVPEKRRRITVRKFRKEWSEGLLLPLTDFAIAHTYTEGDDVAELLSITHYEPPVTPQETSGALATGPRRKYPKTIKGWFFFTLHALGFKSAGRQLTEEVSFEVPAYDVESIKNYKHTFLDGEQVIVTERIHGSNARYLFLEGKMYAGSHYQWKAENSPCVFRKALERNPWIEQWCRAHEGFTLYGEVTPTQKGFNYGHGPADIGFYVFDIYTPEGVWLKPHLRYSTQQGAGILSNVLMPLDMKYLVPQLYVGPFSMEEIKKYVDGPSMVPDAKHLREGIVITPVDERRTHGLGRVQLKLVSNTFLEKDGK